MITDEDLYNLGELQQSAWALGIHAMRGICRIEERLAMGAALTATKWCIREGRILPSVKADGR